jgi:4-amino-4-deoxy-L-arabinose transferase-like glycosyltransferase
MSGALAPPRLTFRTPLRRALLSPLAACIPLALVAGLFLFQLGARDLVSSHEARAAQNAQRMIDTGEWGLPTLFDGQRDLQKPPGFYWLVAAVGKFNAGSVSPWVARLPAAAAALAAVLLVYVFLRREGSRTGAVVGAIVLATANHFVAIGRTARIDVPLTFAVTAALVAFYRGVSPPRRAGRTFWFLGAALAAGCAVLLKGPVGLALIGLTAVAFLVVERLVNRGEAAPDRPQLPFSAAVLGIIVTALVAVPWFVWANHATDGDFVRVFFWHHNVARFTGDSESLASHPWWYYGPRFAMAFLPWTLLAPLGVWMLRSGAWRTDRPFRFGAVWVVVMLTVLSASKFKRADYLLPAFPGAAIAIGCAAERWLSSRERQITAQRAKWAFGVLFVGALAVWPVMWFAVEPREAAKQEKQPFAEAIRRAAPKPEPILLFRTESHLLAYHLAAPLYTLVEWGELKDALSAPGPHAVVMPPEYVADAERITGCKLVPVARLGDFTSVSPPRPLVFLRAAE